MNSADLRILQLNTVEMTGGAAIIAWNLHRAYLKLGLKSWIAVGRKETKNSNVFQITRDDSLRIWKRAPLRVSRKMLTEGSHIHGVWLLSFLFASIAEPMRFMRWLRGIEDFNYPASWKILDLPPEKPDIVHCHNLHGSYFDLRSLPWLSRQRPVVITCHDKWLFSGLCAHSFDCERWRTGCGRCPYRTLYPVYPYPAYPRDATDYNWRRKKEIYKECRFYIATPSHWLMKQVEQSILNSAVTEKRVIHHGIDLSVFHRADKQAIRSELGISQDSVVLLFAANGIRRNVWKDYQTMQTAVATVAEHLQEQQLIFLALGENAPPKQIGKAIIHFIAYQKERESVARYYQAADLYIHASKAESWGLTITEALACGTPVIATAVGGIPEQIEDGVTGILTPPGDAKAMAAGIERLFDSELRRKLGLQAAESARRRFSLERQANEYMQWYMEIINNH